MDKISKTGILVALLSVLVASPTVNANMLLDRMIVYFEPGSQSRQDIRVTNVSENNLFLQTEIYKVLNPGAKNEERIRVTNPDDMNLLATPQKSIVAPGAKKTVRLVNLETPKETEEVYRITFRPVTGDVESNQNAIQLLIAYQALIFVRPEKPSYEVVAQREGSKVTFTNNGNSNVILRNGEQCALTSQSDQCVEITTGGRIYAGQSLTVDLPGEGKLLRFGMFDGTREQRQEFRL